MKHEEEWDKIIEELSFSFYKYSNCKALEEVIGIQYIYNLCEEDQDCIRQQIAAEYFDL